MEICNILANLPLEDYICNQQDNQFLKVRIPICTIALYRDITRRLLDELCVVVRYVKYSS